MQMRSSPEVLERVLASPQCGFHQGPGPWAVSCDWLVAPFTERPCFLLPVCCLCPAPGVVAVSELSLLVTVPCGP